MPESSAMDGMPAAVCQQLEVEALAGGGFREIQEKAVAHAFRTG
jgi:hypothetical protein